MLHWFNNQSFTPDTRVINARDKGMIGAYLKSYKNFTAMTVFIKDIKTVEASYMDCHLWDRITVMVEYDAMENMKAPYQNQVKTETQ